MLKGGIKSLISPLFSLSIWYHGLWGVQEGVEAFLRGIYSILSLSILEKSLEIRAEGLGDCYIVGEG